MKQIQFLLVLLFITGLKAQELDATVSVDYQNLPVVNKESLEKFAGDVQNYLNSTRFTGTDWKYAKIKCNFNIQITSAESEINYSGQSLVLSQRKVYKSGDISPMLRVFDNTWSFVYEKNQSFYFNASVFNPLLSFFDYYAYLIIGLESDSWEKLSGTPFYYKANDIVNIARNSSQSKGWDPGSGNFNRRDLVENLLAEKYRVVREGISDYHYAIDLLAQRPGNPQKREIYVKTGQEKIVNFIKSLDAIRTKFDVNAVFIIEKLRTYPDKTVFKTLRQVDPSHTAKYDDALRN
ncbi:MAG: DUF4835 family protein [Ignavibacteriales bacterium]|nr:DUF4835 family protein [Ignavibacteriales bacterium]